MIRKGTFISDRYEILDKVGSGGMSDVYKARCHKLNRNVAIKVLKHEFSEDKNFVSKFRVEAQNAASLAHPNIVSIYDVGQDHGLYYIVMELVEGITLKQYIARKGKLSVKEAVSIGIQIAQGIECAHNNQIIHRDIKPQNIIISRDGKVKVTDFGIARAASVNTHTTNAMGSVHYISPEQAKGAYIDEKSDIYSLGITLYEMFTGHVPFDGDSTVTIALQHVQKQVPSIKEEFPDIPVGIEKIVLKCTQNKAGRRYLKISSLIADLKKALINPFEDFVQFEEEQDNSSTVMISDNDMTIIQNASGRRQHVDISKEEDNEGFEDVSGENNKLDKVILIGGIIVVVIFLIIMLVIISDTFTGSGSTPSKREELSVDSKSTVVPEVIGLTESGAREELLSATLGIKYQYEFNDEVEKGLICAQSEAKGNVVDKNTTITVTVSKGQERITLPSNMQGKKVDLVIEQLQALGLKWDVTYKYGKKAAGKVISTSPAAPSSVSKDDVIMITVSRGAKGGASDIDLVQVPSVVGKTLESATNLLENDGFIVGDVVEDYSSTVAKGSVIRMTVKAGKELPEGSIIGLVISLGEEETEAPTEVPTEAPTEAPTTPPTTEIPTEEPTMPSTIYSGQVSFTKSELESHGITEGTVRIFVDGSEINVDAAYQDVSIWPDVYSFTVTSYNQTVTVQLTVGDITITRDFTLN